MASSWQEHFGYKTDPFKGIVKDAGGTDVYTYQDTPGHGIGFGPGDLRKTRRAGWSALSILEYLKGPGGRGNSRDDQGNLIESQWHKDTGGQGVVPQSVINELRQDEATQQRMAQGWERFGDMFEGYAKKSDIPDAPDLSDYQTKSDLDTQFAQYAKTDSLSDYAKQADVTKNTADISKAMIEAQKVRQNNPYAVTGNTAMGIQQQQSPSQVAGQISAGLAGFSRNQKKFQNKTLNV